MWSEFAYTLFAMQHHGKTNAFQLWQAWRGRHEWLIDIKSICFSLRSWNRTRIILQAHHFPWHPTTLSLDRLLGCSSKGPQIRVHTFSSCTFFVAHVTKMERLSNSNSGLCFIMHNLVCFFILYIKHSETSRTEYFSLSCYQAPK